MNYSELTNKQIEALSNEEYDVISKQISDEYPELTENELTEAAENRAACDGMNEFEIFAASCSSILEEKSY